MPKIWDYCKTCGKPLFDCNYCEKCGRMLPVSESNEEDKCDKCGQMLLREFRDCKRCHDINILFKFLLLIIIGLIIFLGFCDRTKNWFGLIGLMLDILGAYLVTTGFLESMVQAASGFSGGDVVRDLKKKHSLQMWSGLLCLILGFLLQAINLL